MLAVVSRRPHSDKPSQAIVLKPTNNRNSSSSNIQIVSEQDAPTWRISYDRTKQFRWRSGWQASYWAQEFYPEEKIPCCSYLPLGLKSCWRWRLLTLSLSKGATESKLPHDLVRWFLSLWSRRIRTCKNENISLSTFLGLTCAFRDIFGYNLKANLWN